jgi:heme exporter protein B
LKPALTVAENLSFWASVFGTRSIEAALEAYNLTALRNRPAGALSAGQKRRLGLSRMLVTGRAIWVMDEPTVSLDQASVALFATAVRDHLAAQGSALIATHIDLGLDAAVLDVGPYKAKPVALDDFDGRDLRLAVRAGGGFGLGLAFFLIVTVLVPFSVGPSSDLLTRIAPGVLWLGALLSCLLSLDRLLALYWEDGSLDLLATAPLPLEAVVSIKALAHWITTGLPLVLAAPLLGVLLSLPPEGYKWVVISLFLGTPALSVIGTFGAALTVGLKRGGLLLSLLVMPLYVPTLIFGAEAARRGALGMEVETPLLMLAGISAAVIALMPFASAAVLRINLR